MSDKTDEEKATQPIVGYRTKTGEEALNKIITKLEEDLSKERTARSEERFISLLVLVIILDILFFTLMPSLSGPIAILVLQLLLLVPVARMMKIDEITKLLYRAFFQVAKRKDKADSD